jgi:hypothetical protein
MDGRDFELDSSCRPQVASIRTLGERGWWFGQDGFGETHRNRGGVGSKAFVKAGGACSHGGAGVR